jgi:hypothetical protein
MARPRLSAAWVLAAAAALALETSTHLADFGLEHLRIRLLDSSYEWSYSHILATVAFAAGALVAGMAATWSVARRPAWWAACALFAILFLDGITRFHVQLGFWPLLYAPLLVGLGLSIVVVVEGTELAGVAYAGLGLLLASLVLHVVGRILVVRVFGWGPDAWGYQVVKIALKEGLELAGWTLIVPSLALLALRARALSGVRAPA